MRQQGSLTSETYGGMPLFGAVTALTAGLLLALAGTPLIYLLLIAGGAAYLVLTTKSVREPLFFVLVFLLVLETLPPFFFSSLGEMPVYVSFFLLFIGIAIIFWRFPEMHFAWDAPARGLATFLVGTALSLPFAWWLSGPQVGWESTSRWILLSQTALIYFLIRAGTRFQPTRTERWMIRLLLVGALLSAGYGIVDFIWPVPLPHPAADQFIWLGTAVLRRAQGVFYESSYFANFCGIFLVVASAAYLTRKERILGVPRWFLVFLIAAFSLAVLVAFSRSTWAGITVAMLVFIFHSDFVKVKRGAIFLLALAVPLYLLWTFSPDLWNYFLDARLTRLTDIFSDPNLATSGRFDTWIRVLTIIGDHPQYLAFGVGYKTLTFTRLFHDEIITDNGYLSLLLETGVVGLVGFLVFSAAILRTFSKLSRSKDESLAFWSALVVSLWCGELVQLVAVDAYTYWRNMTILVALMAFILNQAERIERAGRPEEERLSLK